MKQRAEHCQRSAESILTIFTGTEIEFIWGKKIVYLHIFEKWKLYKMLVANHIYYFIAHSIKKKMDKVMEVIFLTPDNVLNSESNLRGFA